MISRKSPRGGTGKGVIKRTAVPTSVSIRNAHPVPHDIALHDIVPQDGATASEKDSPRESDSEAVAPSMQNSTHVPRKEIYMIPRESLDPVRERLLKLELEVKDFGDFADLCQTLSGTDDKSDDQLSPAFRRLLSDVPSGRDNFEFAALRRRLRGVRVQLASVAIFLRDQYSHLTTALLQAREQLLAGDHNRAFRTLLDEERRFLVPARNLVERVRDLIRERLFEQNGSTLTIIDFVAERIFSSPQRKETSPESFRTPATLLSVVTARPAAFLNEMRSSGIRAPLSLLPISELATRPVWNSVIALPDLCRRLVAESGADRECVGVLRQIGSSTGTSPGTQALVSALLGEIITEILATIAGGPAYATAALEMHASSCDIVSGIYSLPHSLPPYLRWVFQVATLRELGFRAEADLCEQVVTRLYGPIQFASQPITALDPSFATALTEIVTQAPVFARIVSKTPLQSLGGVCFEEVLPPFSTRMLVAAKRMGSTFVSEAFSACNLTPVKHGNGNGHDIGGQSRTIDSGDDSTTSKTSPLIFMAAARFAYENAFVSGTWTNTETVVRLSRALETSIERGLDEFLGATPSEVISETQIRAMFRSQRGRRTFAELS